MLIESPVLNRQLKFPGTEITSKERDELRLELAENASAARKFLTSKDFLTHQEDYSLYAIKATDPSEIKNVGKEGQEYLGMAHLLRITREEMSNPLYRETAEAVEEYKRELGLLEAGKIAQLSAESARIAKVATERMEEVVILPVKLDREFVESFYAGAKDFIYRTKDDPDAEWNEMIRYLTSGITYLAINKRDPNSKLTEGSSTESAITITRGSKDKKGVIGHKWNHLEFDKHPTMKGTLRDDFMKKYSLSIWHTSESGELAKEAGIFLDCHDRTMEDIVTANPDAQNIFTLQKNQESIETWG